MQQDDKDRRRLQIRTAAYELLESKGYKATSMLAIAKRAKASNETLYAWYGNKQALFQTLIEENANTVSEALKDALHTPSDIEMTLNRVGALLLKVVTAEKAVALNRAAAADVSETGVLGATLASAGRGAIKPLLIELFSNAQASGQLSSEDSEQMVGVYLGLLIGDLQIRRAIGALQPLSTADMKKRSANATRLTLKLFS